MTLRVACDQCGCRFAVIGAAYFCPACGHNSAERTFTQSLDIARRALAAIPDVRTALMDRDTAAQVVTEIIEGQLSSLVTAFQRFAEVEYPHLPAPQSKLRRNVFQNLQEGGRLWELAGGTSYTSILTPQELTRLHLLFQQRHVLEHRAGIVDDEYLLKSGDAAYAVGQRLVIRESAVLELAVLVEKLGEGLRRDLSKAPKSLV